MNSTNVSPLNLRVAVRRELQAAARSGVAIRVCRDEIEDGFLKGFVIAVGPNLFVIECISDSIYLDGFVCLRIEDVSRVEHPAPNWDFLKTALSLRKQHRSNDLAIDCESVPTLLKSIPQSVGLISVHTERIDTDVCFIGKIARVGEETLSLDTISTNAKWDEQGMDFRLSDITQVGFGGAYEDALFAVASRTQT